jgi:hypothetical protein
MERAADLVADLARALLDEEHARAELRATLDRQADLLHQLRAEGLTLPVVAGRVLRCRGLVLPITQRLKVAERLRKRAARRTTRPLDLVGAHGLDPTPASLCGRAITPEEQEVDMARIVKKTTTVTTEYVEPEEPDEDQEVETDEAEEEPVEDEGEAEGSAKPRRRRRR